jgi:hypothetical protein
MMIVSPEEQPDEKGIDSVITWPDEETLALQVPDPLEVFEPPPVVGAVQPVGNVIVTEPPNERFEVNVKVNMNSFPDDPAAVVVGDTDIVPDPSPVAAAATPMSTKGAASAPIMTMGKTVRRKRFIVIHLSLSSRWLTVSCLEIR